LEPRLRRLRGALSALLNRPDRNTRLLALDRDLTGTFPGRLAALKEALAAKELSLADLPAALRARLIAKDGTALVQVLPAEDIRETAALRRFVESVQSVAPRATGTPVVELRAGDTVIRAFAVATCIALAVIMLLLYFVLRSLRDMALVLAPVLLAGILTLAVSVLADRPFNFANIIVLPLLLGLGAASGIHIVMRARRTGGARLLTTSTPRAILFSALTTIASFGSLSISAHRGTSSMGELLTTAIAMTLICALLFLPALMACIGWTAPPTNASPANAPPAETPPPKSPAAEKSP
jgi:predicted RND superfamily exporter protein